MLSSVLPGLLLTTLALLLALNALGLSLQLGDRRAASRRPHHVLYFAVVAGTLLCTALAGWQGRAWWALLPALAALLGMARTRPGRPGHWRLALLASGLWLAGAWLAGSGPP